MYLLVCVHACVYGRVCNCIVVAVVHRYSACLHPHNLSVTIHTAHAQKHFSPETKTKVRPKFFFALAGHGAAAMP